MTWIKVAGLLGLFLCCFGAGVYYRNRLYKRAVFLETVENLCAYTTTQIRYTCAPIYDIWKDARVKSEFASLHFLNALESGNWKQNVRQYVSIDAASNGVTGEDVQILLEWFDGLGNSDLEGQIEHCIRYSERLSVQRNQARERAGRVGKLYSSLGALGGVAAVLLLW